MIRLLEGDCSLQLRALADNSIDSVITDPPYGLKFRNNHWDCDVPKVDVWLEVLRVLKPGGYLISFSGTRTYHRMVVAIEDAGFEIRDQLGWIYTTGYPKSMDVGKMIDKASRGVPQGSYDPTSPNHGKYKGGTNQGAGPGQFMKEQGVITRPEAATLSLAARAWLGWGTSLKPSFEPAVLARKPTPLTIAANILTYGVGALNVDAIRVKGADGILRFPTNTMVDGSDDVMTLFPSSEIGHRYFYCAKATQRDRDGSHHPTVKPVALMRHLCRMVTPRGGTVLDPFAGSGSTAQAAMDEGCHAVLVEREADYCRDIRRRFIMFMDD